MRKMCLLGYASPTDGSDLLIKIYHEYHMACSRSTMAIIYVCSYIQIHTFKWNLGEIAYVALIFL